MASILSAVEGFISNKTEVEKKLDEALSNANYGAPQSLLREIAAYTDDPSEFPIIMRDVWNSLNHAGKNWRRIYKGLVLLEVLVKNGNDRVVQDARDCIFRIRTLTDFSYHENGADKGAGIRDKATAIVELLSDGARLKAERTEARRMRDKFVGISNVGTPSAPASREMSRDAYAVRGYDMGPRRGTTDAPAPASRSGYDDDVGTIDTADFGLSGSSRAVGSGTSVSGGGAGGGGRRGRRPQGGATIAEPPPATSTDADFDNAFGTGTEVDAFGDPAPTAPSSHVTPSKPTALTAAPPSGAKIALSIKPAAAAARPATLRAPAAAPAVAESFDPFGASSGAGGGFGDFHAAPAAVPAPAPAPQGNDLSFLSYAPSPAHVPAPAAAFDPFGASPAPAPAAVPAAYASADPFAAGHIMMQFGGAPSSAAVASPATAAGEFGGFTTAPPRKDDDMDRLVALDGLSLGDKAKGTGAHAAAATAARPAVPLRAMGAAARPAAPSMNVMSGTVGSGAATNISTLNMSMGVGGAAAPYGAPAYGAPAYGGVAPGAFGHPAAPPAGFGGVPMGGGMGMPPPQYAGYGGAAPPAFGYGYGAAPMQQQPGGGMGGGFAPAPRPQAPAPSDPFGSFGAF